MEGKLESLEHGIFLISYSTHMNIYGTYKHLTYLRSTFAVLCLRWDLNLGRLIIIIIIIIIIVIYFDYPG